MENRLVPVGRFEFLVHCAPEWLPAIYRSRKSGRTVALCRDGWVLTQEGFRARNGAVGVAGGEGYPVRRKRPESWLRTSTRRTAK